MNEEMSRNSSNLPNYYSNLRNGNAPGNIEIDELGSLSTRTISNDNMQLDALKSTREASTLRVRVLNKNMEMSRAKRQRQERNVHRAQGSILGLRHISPRISMNW